MEPVESEVETADDAMPALWWTPDAGGELPRSGLVVFQEIFGLSDYVLARCADLAQLGYVVCAPQIYWRLGVRAVPEDAPDLLEQGIGLMQRVDWDAAVADGLAALRTLLARPDVDDAGVLGFCFGGGLAFSVAAGGTPDVLVSYYGSALPGLLDQAPQVTCPSLHHVGTADAYLPMDQVTRIRDAVTEGGTREDVRVELHEGAGHAFDNPLPAFHHAGASAAAWEQTMRFLEETLT